MLSTISHTVSAIKPLITADQGYHGKPLCCLPKCKHRCSSLCNMTLKKLIREYIFGMECVWENTKSILYGLYICQGKALYHFTLGMHKPIMVLTCVIMSQIEPIFWPGEQQWDHRIMRLNDVYATNHNPLRFWHKSPFAENTCRGGYSYATGSSVTGKICKALLCLFKKIPEIIVYYFYY